MFLGNSSGVTTLNLKLQLYESKREKNDFNEGTHTIADLKISLHVRVPIKTVP